MTTYRTSRALTVWIGAASLMGVFVLVRDWSLLTPAADFALGFGFLVLILAWRSKHFGMAVLVAVLFATVDFLLHGR